MNELLFVPDVKNSSVNKMAVRVFRLLCVVCGADAYLV